jgi:microcystin-dependent protein
LATDATGTPTPLGIPTYNINVDAPSGNGFNAAMAAIDTLIGSRALLASPTFTGDPKAPTPLSTDNDTSIATTAFVQAVVSALVPAGTMVKTAATSAPTGWLLANGAAVSRTTYATLFANIGTTYGAGDGSTTFNLPDMRGRVAVHPDGGTFAAIGGTGGEQTHALTVAELASHGHNLSSDSAGTPAGSVNSASAGTPAGSLSSDSAGTPAGSVSVQALITGGGATQLRLTAASGALAVDTNDTVTASFSGSAMTAHSHTFSGSAMAGHSHTFSGSAMTAHTHTVATAGSGTAHNNLQPYIVLNHIIKT